MDSNLVARLENVANRMESILLRYDTVKNENSANTPLITHSQSSPKLVDLLDNAIGETLTQLCEMSQKIGGDVGLLGEMVKNVFDAHRDFLKNACGREQPDDVELVQLLLDLSMKIAAFTEFKEKNRFSKFYDHICALEAAVGGLLWVAQSKTPASFIKDAIESSNFYINRIFTAYRRKNEQHFEWAQMLKKILADLHEYVLKNHTTGLIWNSESGTKSIENQITPVKTSGPPPPPPPPPQPPAIFPTTNHSKSSEVSALLESLNTGLDATSRLKKVTPEMQTHKNPSLRSSHVVSKSVQNQNFPVEPASVKKIDPRIFWDGKIWKVDYQVGNKNAIVEVTEKKESIYIYKCSDSIIKIKGKANAITLDGCRRTSVVFDGLVAQCEIINSQSVQIQTLGELPTVSIQKTDGCHIYLSREALNAQIVASKSSEMNVSAQLQEEDDEYTEMALPEQFITQIVGKKLVTVASEIV